MSSSSSSSVSSSSATSTPEPVSRAERTRKTLTVPQAEDTPANPEVTENLPLSHAERRRQKRKAQKDPAKEPKPPSKKRKLENGSAAPKQVDPADSRTKRQNSVWVGNLSFKTTADDLRTFFDGVGEITRINMPTKPGRVKGMVENRGFAYVDFATPDSKTLAITLSENPLNGRKLLIKDGDDFAGRPAPATPAATEEGSPEEKDHSVAFKGLTKTGQKILKAQTQPPAPTLFLGNLGFETTEDVIRQLFTAHRRKPQPKERADSEKSPEDKDDDWLRKIRMGTFEDSGLCKGFAFLDFSSIQHATEALVNPKNHQLNGRQLVVQFASVDAVRRGASKDLVGGAKKLPAKRRDASRDGAQRPSSRKGTLHERPEADADAEAEEEEPSEKRLPEKSYQRPRSQDDTRHKGGRSRPKPGAALALAKRQSAAILDTTTAPKKIVF